MIHSMTGYAREESEVDGARVRWELRAVNHRFLDLHVRLPDELRPLEPDTRAAISARLRRGKVDATLHYQPAASSASGMSLDLNRLHQLHDACRTVAHVFGATAPVDPLAVLDWPGVVHQAALDVAHLREPVFALLDSALTRLTDMREREGLRLADLLRERVATVAALCEQVRRRVPLVHEAWRERLRARLIQIEPQAAGADPGRLEQELLMLAQRSDVDEELSRLEGHCEEFQHTLQQSAAVGRRMDFLMQEFNREANTISSKSQDGEVTRLAVEMKVVIEQMREQVQNVE